MALTPEDVVNKRFQTTKFRDGYDQDQVDDFLDEVVVELRRLTQENAELRAQLESGAGEVPAAAPVVPAAPAAPAAPAPALGTDTAAIALSVAEDESGSTSLLILARRLHEEHVREGIEKRDALIAEGHEVAAKLISEAEAREKEMLDNLEVQRAKLQKHVDELRSFEGEYRRKIKTHLEELIAELNATGVGS
ncbi:MAG TPA: DivIVA domain-containing protein [Microbacteriaceae bacterium]|nr:DivIVA domain-containing protein [Microbacteriaceae bacterium]